MPRPRRTDWRPRKAHPKSATPFRGRCRAREGPLAATEGPRQISNPLPWPMPRPRRTVGGQGSPPNQQPPFVADAASSRRCRAREGPIGGHGRPTPNQQTPSVADAAPAKDRWRPRKAHAKSANPFRGRRRAREGPLAATEGPRQISTPLPWPMPRPRRTVGGHGSPTPNQQTPSVADAAPAAVNQPPLSSGPISVAAHNLSPCNRGACACASLLTEPARTRSFRRGCARQRRATSQQAASGSARHCHSTPIRRPRSYLGTNPSGPVRRRPAPTRPRP